MTTKLRFYGYSDDVAYCEYIKSNGQSSYKDAGAYDRTVIASLTSESGSCLVVMRYAPDNFAGTWAVGIAQTDEDIDLPEWAKHPVFDNEEYTVTMELEVPDDTQIKWIGEDEDD